MLPSQRTIDAVQQAHQTALESYREAKKSRRTAQRRAEAATEGHRVIQAVAAETQSQVHNRVATIVSDCLSAVFEEPYQFQIKFEKKRGRTEAVMTFLRNGEEIDPMTASGGGVVDVTSFALRLASIILSQPRHRKLIVLDEPFKFVSREYRPALCELLQRLAETTGFRFLIVTHVSAFEIGNIVNV